MVWHNLSVTDEPNGGETMETTRKYKGREITKLERAAKKTRWFVDYTTFPTLADAKNYIDNGNKARKWSY